MSVAGILLAAGRGTRFGEDPKMLADLDGRPLIRHVADAAAASPLRPLIVVTGEHGPAIRRILGDLSAIFVDNPDFAEGLSTSIRAGFAALPSETRGALVLLGDMPGISSALIGRIVAQWLAGEHTALVPTYKGRRGNPVLLSRQLDSEIATLTGDSGAGPMLRGRTDVAEWESGDPAILADIDTPEALAQAARPSTTPPRIAV